MSDYKRLDDSGLSALVTGYFTKIKDKLEDLGGLSNDAVATVEEETASKNYTTGDYFIKNDKLNVVKQNTTADTTWIKDENYEETSISEELNSINQKIDEIPRPSGTKQVTISQNGTTTEDVEDYENAQITVNVPQPSGKITISQNGTDIDVSSYALADVNVPSNEDAIIDGTLSGAYVNNGATMIDNYKFINMNGLTSATFSSVTEIKDRAFSGCAYLTTLDFSEKVSIGSYAFINCYRLDCLILRNTSELSSLSNDNSFTETAIKYKQGYIYVPSTLKSQYEGATNWSRYATIFRALEDYTVDGTTTGDLDPTKI